MPLNAIESGSPAFKPPRSRRIRWIRVLAAGLALSVSSMSAALLIGVGQLETGEVAQPVVNALRQSPGLPA